MLTSDFSCAPRVPSGPVFSLSSLALQTLATIPFLIALTLNFIMTSVPDYRGAGITILIDRAFPSAAGTDRDNVITGSGADMQYRFRCSSSISVRAGQRAELMVDETGRLFTIAGCAGEEKWAAAKARWSAWVFLSFLLVVTLFRLETVRRPH